VYPSFGATVNNIETHIDCSNIESPYTTNKREAVRKHSGIRHSQDIIIIQEEGLLPQCTNCEIFKKSSHTQQHANSKECMHYAKKSKKKRENKN
jgi:hypothetical protein